MGSRSQAQKCRECARHCLVPGRALASFSAWPSAAVSGGGLLRPFEGQRITHLSSLRAPPPAPGECPAPLRFCSSNDERDRSEQLKPPLASAVQATEQPLASKEFWPSVTWPGFKSATWQSKAAHPISHRARLLKGRCARLWRALIIYTSFPTSPGILL